MAHDETVIRGGDQVADPDVHAYGTRAAALARAAAPQLHSVAAAHG